MYAGFWRRFGAVLIDGILLSIVTALLAAILSINVADPGYSALSTGIWLIYYIAMEGSTRQATLGKIALRIKVTDLQGNPVSYGTAAVRNVSKILSGLILGIGYLMAAFTEKKQALHDMIASTLVVPAQAVPQAAPGGQPPGWGQAPTVPPGPTPPQASPASPPTVTPPPSEQTPAAPPPGQPPDQRPEDQPPR